MATLPTQADLEAVYEEVTALLNLPDTEWKKVGTEHEVVVHKRKYKKGSGVRTIKTTGVVKRPVEDVKKAFVTMEERHNWDQMCKAGKAIRKVGDVEIMHMEMPEMPMLSSRDAVFYAHVRPDGAGGYLGISKSLENSEAEVPVDKKVIRVDVFVSGVKLEAITVDGQPATKMITIIATDPKGSVPKVNLKPVMMKGAHSVQAMREYLEKKN